MKIVSIISDTHKLLRKVALEHLADSDLILHAGDVGDIQILDELRNICDVKVVKGNIDDKVENLSKLDEVLEFEYEGFKFIMLHNIVGFKIDDYEKPDIVIYGHSHMPYEKMKGEILYLNPGSIGPKRFTLPISMLKIHINKSKLKLEWINL